MRYLNIMLAVFVVVMLAVAAIVWLSRPVRRSAMAHVELRYRINVNTADADTMCLLHGIGPKLAQNVVSYREANGPFQTVDELDHVSRIGPITLENVRPYVTVGKGDR